MLLLGLAPWGAKENWPLERGFQMAFRKTKNDAGFKKIGNFSAMNRLTAQAAFASKRGKLLP